MEYEKLVEEIKKVPRTYLPALLIEMIKYCYVKGVFKDNNPIPFLTKVADECKIDCADFNKGK